MEEKEQVIQLAQKLYEKKAENILVLNVSHLTVLCDYMLIASGRTAAQVSSLADYTDLFMSENHIPLRRSEGLREGRWSILDYGSIMVHLFHRDERAYYGLDRLWNDGSNTMDLPFDQTASD